MIKRKNIKSLPWKTNHRCPNCDEEDFNPMPNIGCICKNPLMVYISPGKHIHINCPMHGDVKIYGSPITWMTTNRRSALQCAL